MELYNQRGMKAFQSDLERGKYKYVQEVLNYLKRAEEEDDLWALNQAEYLLEDSIYKMEEDMKQEIKEVIEKEEKKKKRKSQLSNTEIDDIDEIDEKTSKPKTKTLEEKIEDIKKTLNRRKEFLLNYFLNVESAVYKKKDAKYTKWEIFVEKATRSHWEPIKKFIEELETYVSSQNDSKDEENLITEEVVQKLNQKYESVILPYIQQHLGIIDSFRATLRLTQRLNLIKKKVPVNQSINFGDWIKQKRKALGWSLYQLSEKAGYSPAYIYRIEKGERKNPTPQVVSRLVSALGYDPDDYLSIMMFEGETDQRGSEPLKPLEISDLLLMKQFSINGRMTSAEQRAILSEIIQMIDEDDILQAPKINKLKKKIQTYQKLRRQEEA